MPDGLDVLARRLVASAELDDGILTDIMRAAVAQTGALLVGLDNRIKALASLKRKLGDALVLAPELSLQEAAEQIYDVLRFTVVADADRYKVIRDAVLAELQRHGADVESQNNRWAGPGYRGINVRLTWGVDRRFEVQFHTRQSYQAAKSTRGQYEELRRAETSVQRAEELTTAIEATFAEVPVPPEALE